MLQLYVHYSIACKTKRLSKKQLCSASTKDDEGVDGVDHPLSKRSLIMTLHSTELFV